jgi:chaperonin cofactor prefoldin
MQKEHFEILLESVDSKMQLVLEGYSVLANQIKDTKTELLERADLTDFKLDVLNKKIDTIDKKLSGKIDAVAADLKEHRSDTEAHHSGLYVVKEGEGL